MIERGAARPHDVECSRRRRQPAADAPVKMPEQHQAPGQDTQAPPERGAVGQAIETLPQAGARVNRRMMHQNDGRPAAHLRMRQRRLERRQLLGPEVPRRDERGAGNRAGQGDDRCGSAQLDAGIPTRRQVEREIRQVAAEVVTEVVREAAPAKHGGKVDVVIAGDHGHVDAAGDLIEQGARAGELALEGEISDVAGDDEVIRLPRCALEHGLEIGAPVHPPSPADEVEVAGDPLVEEDGAPPGAVGRQDVRIGDVGDANHDTAPVGYLPGPKHFSFRYSVAAPIPSFAAAWARLPPTALSTEAM
jgi:hypothetical protein